MTFLLLNHAVTVDPNHVEAFETLELVQEFEVSGRDFIKVAIREDHRQVLMREVAAKLLKRDDLGGGFSKLETMQQF
jgi:hypothetical protein